MIPDTFTIGVTDVPAVAFTPPKVAPGQHLVDLVVQQNLVRESIGERGVCVDGTWQGWCKREQDAAGVFRYTINVPALRTWVGGLPPDLEWVGIDDESNVGEFDYPGLLTNRALRAINFIINQVRPDLKLVSMYQSGNLTYGGTSPEQLAALTRERAGGVATRGAMDAQSGPSFQCYPDETTTNDDIDRQLDAGMAIMSQPGVLNAGQAPACWFWTKSGALSVRTMAHLGGSARRHGVRVALMWDYVPDMTSGDEGDVRMAQRAAWFDVHLRPQLEAFGEAFL